jgi:hypothetical protein
VTSPFSVILLRTNAGLLRDRAFRFRGLRGTQTATAQAPVV